VRFAARTVTTRGPIAPVPRRVSRDPKPLETIAVKSAVETLDATTVKLTVEVTPEDLKPSIDHAYEHIAQEITVPGFRKGKVPPRIVDQRVGRAAVSEHAVHDAMSGFYRQAGAAAGQPLRARAGRSVGRRGGVGAPAGPAARPARSGAAGAARAL